MILHLPDTLLTGIQAVDDQHLALVALHNEIVTGFDEQRPPYYTIEALARLYQYSRQHFESEERIMLRYGYEGLDEHQRDHRALLEQLRRVVLDYRRRPESVNESIKSFVHEWVVQHIEEDDLEFAAPVLGAMEREREALVAEAESPVEIAP